MSLFTEMSIFTEMSLVPNHINLKNGVLSRQSLIPFSYRSLQVRVRPESVEGEEGLQSPQRKDLLSKLRQARQQSSGRAQAGAGARV